MKLDLTREGIRPLVITDEETGDKIRFTFTRILNRQQRQTMTKRIGRGSQAREVPDLEKLYSTCVATMGPMDRNKYPDLAGAMDEQGIINKPDVIAQFLLITENQGGLPEETVDPLIRYLMGENVLGDERGND